VAGDAALTAAELRDLAGWLTGLANTLDTHNREAVPSLAR
jgi:hypothetical protein